MPLPLFEEIRIENTNSCGYRCVMCPREKLTRSLGYMSVEDFELVLDRVGPKEEQVHLHGFGEPLLDRSLVQKIKRLKAKAPKSQSLIFSTLGVKIPDIEALATSGLDQIIVSFYGFSRESYAKIHGFDGLDRVKTNLERLSAAIQEARSPLQICLKIPSPNFSTSALPVAMPPDMAAFCQWAENLNLDLGYWSRAHNYGNGRSFNKPDPDLLCPVVGGRRKNILNITWDLFVIPCCFDFNATIRFGNLRDQSLEEIFSGPEYQRFVIAHRSGAADDYPVCATCEKQDY
jgi:MoaA/NifB/PqqE/SkfB family radical SAM enzyme